MVKFLSGSLVIGLTLSMLGCSMKEAEHAYTRAKTEKALKIPKGLDGGSIVDYFAVPDLTAQAKTYPIGSKLNTQAPVTVVALGNDVRHVYQDKTATVWIEQSIADITQDIESFLKSESIPYQIKKQSKTHVVIETSWVEQEYSKRLDIGFDDESSMVRNKFHISAYIPKGERDAKVRVQRLASHIKVGERWKNYKARETRNIHFLNQFIAERYESTVKTYRDSEFYSQSIKIKMKSDNDNLPVLESSAPYRRTMLKLEQVLDEIGFVIEDKDYSDGLLVTSFDYDDQAGFFSSLFGDEREKLQLASGIYRFQVVSSGRTSDIRISSEEGRLDAQALTKIQPVFSAEFAKKKQ